MTPLARELVRFLAGDAKGRALDDAKRLLLGQLEPISTEAISAPEPMDPRTKRVTDALVANPADARSLSSFAKKAGASSRTLARLFVEETGMTFSEWRMRARVRAALEALANAEPVARVAERVGYQTTSAFIAAFKRQTGTSPRKYFGNATRVE